MMSNSDYWARMLWSFGIQNDDHIVVYDYSDTYSSCRLWFALKYFGHKKVSVLDGGMKKWLKENSHLKILDLGCSLENYWPEANHFADIDDFEESFKKLNLKYTQIFPDQKLPFQSSKHSEVPINTRIL